MDTSSENISNARKDVTVKHVDDGDCGTLDMKKKIELECTICLEPLVNEENNRSFVKLTCDHQFHLDCIGSAFNAKKKMQCPICRNIEQGRWLYASGFSNTNFNFDDLIIEAQEDFQRLPTVLPLITAWLELLNVRQSMSPSSWRQFSNIPSDSDLAGITDNERFLHLIMNGGDDINHIDSRGSDIGGRNGNSGGSSSNRGDIISERNNVYTRNGGIIYPHSIRHPPIDLHLAGLDDNELFLHPMMNGGDGRSTNDGRGSARGGRNYNIGGTSGGQYSRSDESDTNNRRDGGRIYPNSALYTSIDPHIAVLDDNEHFLHHMMNGGAERSNNNGRGSGRGGRNSNGGGRSGGRGNISSRSDNSNISYGGRIHPDSFWYTPHDPHLTNFIDNEHVLRRMMNSGNISNIRDGRGRGRGRRSSNTGGINGSRGGRSGIRDNSNRNDGDNIYTDSSWYIPSGPNFAGFPDNRNLFRRMMNGGDVRRSNHGTGNGEGARSRNSGGSSGGRDSINNINDGGISRNGRGVHEYQRRGHL